MAQHIGDAGGASRTVSVTQIGDGAAARKVMAGWIGENGVARRFCKGGIIHVDAPYDCEENLTYEGFVPYDSSNPAVPLEGQYTRVTGTVYFNSIQSRNYDGRTFRFPGQVKIDFDLEGDPIGQSYDVPVPQPVISAILALNSGWSMTGAIMTISFTASSFTAYLFYHLNYDTGNGTLDYTDLRSPGINYAYGNNEADVCGVLTFYEA